MNTLMQAALAVSGALFDSLWEGALIVGLVWLGLRCMPQVGAATRYAIWLCALSALVLVPVATVLVPASPQLSAPPPVTTSTDASVAVIRANVSGVELPDAYPVETPHAPRITVSQSLALVVALVWLLAACARIILLLKNLRDLAVIRRESRPWSSTHDYPVSLSHRVAVPLALGFLRPAIVLPTSIVQEEPDDAVSAIIMHESAHLRRNDVWTNALARVLEALVTLNPIAWLVLRRVATEREIACDDWVVARLGAGDVFARALAAMASCAGARPSLAAPSAIGSRHSVVARIEHLLDARPRRLRLSPSAISGALLTFALTGIVLQSISPVLAYAPPSPQSIQAASGCTTPNRSIRSLMEIDHTNSVERLWVGPAKPGELARRVGAQHFASVDLTVDAAGTARKVVIVSAPSYPGVREGIVRSFMGATYEPALRDCHATSSTVRMGAYVGQPGGPRHQTLSAVDPAYPVGWSAAHPKACKVPNLLHSAVPALPASLEAIPARSTLSASVRVQVNSAGSVTNASLVTASGNTALDDAVLAVARAQTYPLAQSTGFKPVRPSHTSLAWNASHGYRVYSDCNPLPAEYVWTTTVTGKDPLLVVPLWSWRNAK